MVRTEIARQRYCRAGLRYASDFTDAEWALIEPFVPLPLHRGDAGEDLEVGSERARPSGNSNAKSTTYKDTTDGIVQVALHGALHEGI